jgi:hypothetical protein
MDATGIAVERLQSQRLRRSQLQLPGEVVGWMVAVQAQDYAGAKWSVGLRQAKSTEAEVEESLTDKIIVRSWVMRGTLHFVASVDLRWLLTLLAPTVIAGNKRRYRELELDEGTLSRSNALLAKAVDGGNLHSRKELLELLKRNGIPTEGQRGVYMLQRASLDGLICQGVVQANNPEFMSLDGFPERKTEREEALAELARRYFNSRGPATLKDFTWWSGLPASEARAGLASIEGELRQEMVDGTIYWQAADVPTSRGRKQIVHLLPGFDEYLLAYKDRSASLGKLNFNQLAPTGGMLPGTIVIDGRVAGTWKRTFKKGEVIISLHPFRALSHVEETGVALAGKRLGEFLGLQASIQ